ncbi:protein TPR3 isoform X1 [Tanacetum coccineum]
MNRFLIKCWDMDNTSLLTTIDADGGLPAFDQVPAFEDGDLSLFGDNNYFGKAMFLTKDWEGAIADMKGTAKKIPQDMAFRNQLYDCLNITSLMLISYSLEGDDKRSKYDNTEDIEEGMNMGVVVVIRFISKVAFLAVDGTVDNIGFVYRMALLLGPPSSGKTTLLLALAEKLIKYELPSMN